MTTTPGIGVHWLTPRLGEFLEIYPEVHITLLTTEEEFDLAMREADVAIRLRQPTQPDLIQRKLFSVHFHVYASPEYLKRFGTPRTFEDLDSHRVLMLGGNVPNYLQRSLYLTEVARNGKGPRTPHLVINNILGILRACQRGIGIAMLPDYLVEGDGGLVQLFSDSDPIALDAYFVYPEELKIRRTRPGVSRFSRRQRTALEPLELPPACGANAAAHLVTRNDVLHGWHVHHRVVQRGSSLHICNCCAARLPGSSQISNRMHAVLPSGR